MHLFVHLFFYSFIKTVLSDNVSSANIDWVKFSGCSQAVSALCLVCFGSKESLRSTGLCSFLAWCLGLCDELRFPVFIAMRKRKERADGEKQKRTTGPRNMACSNVSEKKRKKKQRTFLISGNHEELRYMVLEQNITQTTL